MRDVDADLSVTGLRRDMMEGEKDQAQALEFQKYRPSYEANSSGMYQRLEANKWSFKQAGKTRRPDGTRVYGVYPLPNDAGPSSFADLTNAQGELECKTLENWLPVSAMPSNIHAELLHHGIIKDPSLGLNEDDVQCGLLTSLWWLFC